MYDWKIIPSSDFVNKIKSFIHFSGMNAILAKIEVLGLCSSIRNKEGLKALRWILEKRDTQKISTDDIVKITGFILTGTKYQVAP